MYNNCLQRKSVQGYTTTERTLVLRARPVFGMANGVATLFTNANNRVRFGEGVAFTFGDQRDSKPIGFLSRGFFLTGYAEIGEFQFRQIYGFHSSTFLRTSSVIRRLGLSFLCRPPLFDFATNAAFRPSCRGGLVRVRLRETMRDGNLCVIRGARLCCTRGHCHHRYDEEKDCFQFHDCVPL